MTQSNYDLIVEQFKNGAPFDRVVSIEEEIEIRQEEVLPYEQIKNIIEKYDIIGVNQCYCRNWNENRGIQCKLDAPKFNCVSFGRYASFIIDHNFGKSISKEEAMKIFKEAEDYGLVHKALHVHQNPEEEELTICNCCNCCCLIFQSYERGFMAFHTFTSYLAYVDENKCKGCGICVEKCHIEAIELVDDISVINIDRCIGCGVCAYHCPENARTMKRTGLRKVFIPPPKIADHDLKLLET